MMHSADMPLDMTTAQPIFDLEFLLARFAFAGCIKVVELECLIAAELTCIARWALDTRRADRSFACRPLALHICYGLTIHDALRQLPEFRVPAHPTTQVGHVWREGEVSIADFLNVLDRYSVP